MSATWPGLDSVGTRVCDTPNVPSSRTLERRNGVKGRGSWAEGSFATLGDGSGKDWNALSARSPSPVCMKTSASLLVAWVYRFLLHTNIKHQSLRRSLGPLHAVGPHATNDGTPEVDIENGEDVDEMEDDCNAQEAQAPEPRHDELLVFLPGIQRLHVQPASSQSRMYLAARCPSTCLR